MPGGVHAARSAQHPSPQGQAHPEPGSIPVSCWGCAEQGCEQHAGIFHEVRVLCVDSFFLLAVLQSFLQESRGWDKDCS